jgi:hypothetical protein
MTLPLNPLFRCPCGQHGDGQQQARANKIQIYLSNRGRKVLTAWILASQDGQTSFVLAS